MVGGGEITVQDANLLYTNASIQDMQRLLDSVRLRKCIYDDCTRAAFEDAAQISNRAGRCETFFEHDLPGMVRANAKNEAARIAATALSRGERDAIVNEILALKLFNSYSGCDVDVDDVFTYFDEVDVPSVQGFQDWLRV